MVCLIWFVRFVCAVIAYGRAANEAMTPEIVARILDQLDKLYDRPIIQQRTNERTKRSELCDDDATSSPPWNTYGDEQAPRMRSVDDESLEQHARDLLLHDLLLRLGEQRQQRAREVVRVRVRVAQLCACVRATSASEVSTSTSISCLGNRSIGPGTWLVIALTST